jgi:hypothetical protein
VCIGKDRRWARNFGVGKDDHVSFVVEIVDGLIAEIISEHECVGALAGHERIARAANQHLNIARCSPLTARRKLHGAGAI